MDRERFKRTCKTIEYRERNFTKKEIKKLSHKIESVTALISQNPKLFPKSNNKNVYKATILKFNTLYYRVVGNDVEILSFFLNKQNPDRRKL